MFGLIASAVACEIAYQQHEAEADKRLVAEKTSRMNPDEAAEWLEAHEIERCRRREALASALKAIPIYEPRECNSVAPFALGVLLGIVAS